MYRVFLLLVVCVVLPAKAASVVLTQGVVVGSTIDNIHHFRGVPYARPPVGDLRWQLPVALPPSTKLHFADTFAPGCLQNPAYLKGAPTSEDCLNLNVWSPDMDPQARLPVMVWIHGGGFRVGSNVINGEVFAELGVVFVSINYRLGSLGFFAHEALGQSVANFGLQDMELALTWIQENIDQFGGDRERVTIFGVSAGGQAVNLLMSSLSARNLFHGAIAQSGYGTWALPRTANAPAPAPLNMSREAAASAEQIAIDLVDRITEAPQSAEMMRSLDGMSLVNAGVGFQLPIVDGISLREEPGLLFMRGEQNPVPYISGGNSLEGSVQVASGISDEHFSMMIGDHLDVARTLYPDDPEDIWLTRMFGDNRYLLSARMLTEAMAKVSMPSWRYYNDYLSPDQVGQPGTQHGFDARYLFGGHLYPDRATKALAKNLRRYWVNFSRTGNPNDPSSPVWRAVDNESDNWLLLDNEGIKSRQRVIGDKLGLLERLYRLRVSPALSP